MHAAERMITTALAATGTGTLLFTGLLILVLLQKAL